VARSLWSGSLSFGLVNVPVNVVSAVRDLDFHFRQLHEKDGAPIDVQRWCSKEDVEVPFDEIMHSYEPDDGKHVIVTDEELEAIEPRRTRTIDIEQFVGLDDVDPIYFDHPYLLVPGGADDGTARGYCLLAEVMAQAGRVALGRFVMRAKEYLAIIRVREEALTLTTMLFADEVRSTKDIDNASQKSHAPSRKQLDAAVAVIEELSTDWDPAKHKDRYRARLKRVVERKQEGHTIRAPESPEPADGAPDLMDALERTLAEMRSRGGNGGSGSRRKRQRQEAK
jgi:DNA end-binding protein Ku